MKHYLYFLILLLSTSHLIAQSDHKSIVNPKQDKLEDYTGILMLDNVKSYEPVGVNETALYSKLVNLDFEIDRQNEFRIIKHKRENNDYWLLARLPELPFKAPDIKIEYCFKELASFLENSHENYSFEVMEIHSDNSGERHVRLRERINEIPVYDSEIIFHEKSDSRILINGQIQASNHFEALSGNELSHSEVLDKIKSDLGNYVEDALEYSRIGTPHGQKQWESELVYYRNTGIQYIPAYHVRVYANAAERYEYILDARNGDILNKFSTICELHGGVCVHSNATKYIEGDKQNLLNTKRTQASLADGPTVASARDLLGSFRNINTYEFSDDFFMIDASRAMFNSSRSDFPDDPVGVIWTIDLNNTSPVNTNSLYTHINSLDNTWGNSPEGVSAHFNAGKAYEYFKSSFGRESITGTGQNIISFVNVSDAYENSMGNAFWNGIGIYYGNGDNFFESLGRALDVAGHEMSHGVIESTANLEYQNESGAMNEAFADIFGAMIDREDWKIGEDVVKSNAFPSGALRDMSDPHNGASTGDFQRGWQPKHVNEMYTGTEDNGGVHINSGIINHAFYQLAQATDKATAEQIFYRALRTYLTRSSGFREMRFAALQAASDLYGANGMAAVRSAFDTVGILDENEAGPGEDFDINPGSDLLLVSDQNLQQLYVFDLQTGNEIFNPLSTTPLLSKPSVTDDGSRIVFTGTDNHVHLIDIDWNANPPQAVENIISVSADWRNSVISKNGRFIALLENTAFNNIIVFDLETSDVNEFILTNPTYSTGVSTGEVQYADVMEFDATSTSIMYDAFNLVNGNTGTLEFWDIGFIEVWNPQFDTWALGSIDKLFSSLPEGINIGNPTFSKNSPYIIAFDIFENNSYEIIGLNLETGDISSIFTNSGLSYPSYSRDDRFLLYDLDLFGYTDLGVLELETDKITYISNSDQILLPGGKWGSWFSNGERILSSTVDHNLSNTIVKISPNPVQNILNLEIADDFIGDKLHVEILDISGRKYLEEDLGRSNSRIDVSGLSPGNYFININSEVKMLSKHFIKI